MAQQSLLLKLKSNTPHLDNIQHSERLLDHDVAPKESLWVMRSVCSHSTNYHLR